jgi:hypothetical protein
MLKPGTIIELPQNTRSAKRREFLGHKPPIKLNPGGYGWTAGMSQLLRQLGCAGGSGLPSVMSGATHTLK